MKLHRITHTRALFCLLFSRTSAGHALTPQEVAEAKGQLLDIAKVIPAASPFLAPGGDGLLPLMAKALPFDLFPSAFGTEVRTLSKTK